MKNSFDENKNNIFATIISSFIWLLTGGFRE